MDNTTAISVQNLHIAVGDKFVVHDLSFSVGAGKALAIVAGNGSALSLIARAILGILPEYAYWRGSIQLDGSSQRVMSQESPQGSWTDFRSSIAGISSEASDEALNPCVCVGQQLAEVFQVNAGFNSSDAKTTTLEWLQHVLVPNAEVVYNKLPHQLTTGLVQRVRLAFAMSANPEVLVVVEPTSHLDVVEQKEIIQLLKAYHAGTSKVLIYCTKDLALASTVADDIIVLKEAEVIESGSAADMTNSPQNAYTKALLACRPGIEVTQPRLPVYTDFTEGGIEPEPHLVKATSQGTNTVLLQVRHLRVWFPADRDWQGAPKRFIRAIEDVSFDLNQGDFLGIMGESGSGRSVLAHVLSGIQEVESGQILFNGEDLARLTRMEWRRVRQDIQLIDRKADHSLDPRFTIREVISELLSVHRIVSAAGLDTEVSKLLTLVYLPPETASLYSYELNQVQQHQVILARALALRPRLLICDEFLDTLDAPDQALMLNILKKWQAEQKLSCLFISNDLNLVHYLANRVIVMHEGRIVERGTVEDVFRRPENVRTKQLLASVQAL